MIFSQMHKSICLLFLLFLTILPTHGQKATIENTIYLGALIIDRNNIKDMVDLCNYYNFTESASEDDFTVYVSPDGEKIRFKINDTTPIVEVLTRDKTSTIKQTLEHVGFQKSSQGYERGSDFSSHRTLCTVSSSPTVVRFLKEPNAKK